jgi:predicted transcriptional regulator
MPKPVRAGELERSVMTALWDADDGATARDVLTSLPGPELAITTVLTVLDRLERKGMVRRDRQSRPHLYRAVRSRAEFLSDLMVEALDSSDDRGAVLARFIGTVPDDDTATLRALLRRRRS